MGLADQDHFLQTDPVGYEDDLNLYAYVGSDPVNSSDPTGRINWKKWFERIADGVDVATTVADGAAAQMDMMESTTDSSLSGIQRVGAYYDYMGADPFAMNGPPLVIGQNMRRVEAYAEYIGGEIIDVDTTQENAVDASVETVRQAMREGRQIIDIGADDESSNPGGSSRPDRASAYQAELEASRDYAGYRSHKNQADVHYQRVRGAPIGSRLPRRRY